MDDLNESFMRLEWVGTEIRRLDQQVTAYTNTAPLEVYWQYSFSAVPTRLYRTRLRTPVPHGVSIHAGVILNEMRAILDALACTLAVRNGFDDVSGVYFPTGKTKAIFESKDVQRKVKKLSDADKETIAALKPYPGGNDMLYALHSSDLIRKHQRLIVVTGAASSTSIGPGILDGSKLGFINGPGQPVGEVFAQVNHDHPPLNVSQGATVAFSEPAAIKAKPLVATLDDFASLVKSVLKLFA